MKGYFTKETIQMKPGWEPQIEKGTLYIPYLGTSMNSEGHTDKFYSWWFNEAITVARDRLIEVELDDNEVLEIAKSRASLTTNVTELYRKATK